TIVGGCFHRHLARYPDQPCIEKRRSSANTEAPPAHRRHKTQKKHWWHCAQDKRSRSVPASEVNRGDGRGSVHVESSTWSPPLPTPTRAPRYTGATHSAGASAAEARARSTRPRTWSTTAL